MFPRLAESIPKVIQRLLRNRLFCLRKRSFLGLKIGIANTRAEVYSLAPKPVCMKQFRMTFYELTFRITLTFTTTSPLNILHIILNPR